MNINKILIALSFLASAISVSGCKDDIFSEITTLNLDRSLSPTGLSAAVVNKTGVKLTWTAIGNAKYYRAEIFETENFSGTATKIVDSIAISAIPYTITGLAGETKYYARVKALGVDNHDSKWVSATFSTDAEQIFQDVDLTKLTANSVVLNWPAGQAATTIVLSPGDISHSVTTAEIAAGQAVISGLTGETFYTATLMNGTKIRGTKTFTTLIDLGGATKVSPGDDLATIIANATAGQTLALMPGTYNVNADVMVTKSISIKGAKPTDKPIINGLILRVKGNAGLSLKDLILNGTGSLNGNQAIIYDEALNDAYGELKVVDCEIKNYVKGILYLNLKALVESVTFSGNTIYNIECAGGDFIDFRNGIAKTLLFENNTVYNSAHARDLFRMDAGGSTNFPSVTSVITIQTNTFNDVANANRFLYIRLASHQIHFSKNIIANTNGYYTNQAATTISTMASNNYFNAPNFTASATVNAKNDVSTTKTSLDPGFTNASAGNFTITNQTLKENGIGALRWR